MIKNLGSIRVKSGKKRCSHPAIAAAQLEYRSNATGNRIPQSLERHIKKWRFKASKNKKTI